MLSSELGTKTLEHHTVACYSCEATGDYLIAETQVPHFGKLNIISFSCSTCNYKSRKVNTTPTVTSNYDESTKQRITLDISSAKDLNRTIVRSEFCVFRIPSIEFESATCEGTYSTVEGLLRSASDSLKFSKVFNSESVNHTSVVDILDKQISKLIDSIKSGTTISIILEDETHSSFIERFDNLDTNLTETTVIIDETTLNREANQYKQDIANGVYSIEIDPKSIQKGQQFQCFYGDSWFPDCKIVKTIQQDSEVYYFWVCESIDYSDNQDDCKNCWMVTLQEMKTLEGYKLKSSTTDANVINILSNEEGLLVLENMVKKVQIEEGTVDDTPIQTQHYSASLDEME